MSTINSNMNINIDELINESFVKQSFDNLIEKYINPSEGLNKIKNKKGNKSNISSASNKPNFNSENFCNKTCQEKFNKVLKNLKEGKIDINKVDWNEEGGNNFIKDLVNYYYNLGYSHGQTSIQANIDNQANQVNDDNMEK